MNAEGIDIEFAIQPYTPSARRQSIHIESSEFSHADHRSHLQRLVTFLDKPNLRSRDKAQKNLENELEKSPFDAFRRVTTFYQGQGQDCGEDLPMKNFYRQRTSLSIPVTPKERTKPVVGGAPITCEAAMELRQVVFGTCIHCFPREWKEACFTYQNIDGRLPYGLFVIRNCCSGLLLCVQAMIIRRLVFKNDGRPDLFTKNALKPSHQERRSALCWTLCQMLWKAGDNQKCYVCLPQDKVCFKAPQASKYQRDNITEMLHIFEFKRYEDLESFVRRFLTYFESDSTNGAILFLYSLVLSRSFLRIRQDYGSDDVQLLINSDECSPALINLLLTGKAVKYLHNGKVIYNLEGDLLAKPKVGIYERSEIGLLYWNKKEDKRDKTQVGSMLKTPKYPIWVTYVNGYYGLLFSMNAELVSHWRSEHHFPLHYYTGIPTLNQDVIIHVSTRVARSFHARTERGRAEEEKKIPSMDQCIMTKWFGADTDWNGTTPFV